jgi:uncharacterized protein YdaU (DUF1376 family)
VTKRQQPFMPLFVGDFLAATADWDGEAASLYMTLLGYQWTLDSNSLPTDPASICKLVRWDRELFDRFWPDVSHKFVRRGNRLVNERLEAHRVRAFEISKKRAEVGSKGGKQTSSKRVANHEANGKQNGSNHVAIADPLLDGLPQQTNSKTQSKPGSKKAPSNPIQSNPRILAKVG